MALIPLLQWSMDAFVGRDSHESSSPDQKDRRAKTPTDVTVQAIAVDPRPSSPGTMTSLDLSRVFADNILFVGRTLRHLGVHDSDLEDVCQEVFLVVHRRLAEFEGRAALRTWIYQICWRTAQAHLRRTGRDARRRESLDQEPKTEPSQMHELENTDMRARLHRLLAELDHDKRAVFVLYELEELSMREVAETLGCPLQTAYSRLKAARSIVREAANRLGLCQGGEV